MKIDGFLIKITQQNENVLECLQKLLRSFGHTQIEDFSLLGYGAYSEYVEYDRYGISKSNLYKFYPCSKFFEELRYAASKATNSISVYSLELSSKEFIQLIKAAKNCKCINL